VRRAVAILAAALAGCQRGDDFEKLDRLLFCCHQWHARPACIAAFARLPPARIETCPVARELDPSRPHPPEERLCGITATLAERKTAARTLGLRLAKAVSETKCGPNGVRAALDVAIAHTADVCGEDGCLPLLGAAEGIASPTNLARLAKALGGDALLRAFDKVPLPAEKRALLLDGFWPFKGRALVAAMGQVNPSGDDIANLLGMEPAPLQLLRSRYPGARLLLAARGLEALLPDEAGTVIEASPCPIVLAVRERLRLDPGRHRKLVQCDPRLAQAPSAASPDPPSPPGVIGGQPPARQQGSPGAMDEFTQLDHRLSCCLTGHARPECRAAFAKLPPERVQNCSAARELDPAREHPPRERLCGYTATPEQRRSAARFLERRLDEALRRGCQPEGLRAALDVALEEPASACSDDGCLRILQAAGYTRTSGDVSRMALTMGAERLVRALATFELPRADAPLAALLLDVHWPGRGRGLVVLMRQHQDLSADVAPLLTGRFGRGGPLGPFGGNRADVAALLAGDPEPLRLLRPSAPLSRLVLAARGLEPIPPQEIDRIVRWSPCPVLLAVREPLGLDGRWPSLRLRCDPRPAAVAGAPAAASPQTSAYQRPAPVALDPPPDELDEVPLADREKLLAQRGFAEGLRDRYRTPVRARARCGNRIRSCAIPDVPERSLDACAISVEVCKTDTPWTEPACCPRQCIEAYEALRRAGVPPIQATKQLFDDGVGRCFPGGG